MAGMDTQARLTTDNSQFDAAMKKSGEGVTATARAIATESKKSSAAQAFAAKFAADTVSEQSLRIVGTLKQEAAANVEYRRALGLTKAGLLDESTGAQVSAAALQRLTAARIAAAAAAKLDHSSISNQMAASAALRGGGLRADERFLTTIPGAGKALQALFPLIGMAGITGLLVDLGVKGYEAFQKVTHAAELTRAAFEAQHDRAVVSIDDKEIENQKIQDQIDKISGHPNNGLASALLDAKKMADQLLVSLQADRKELESLLKENDTGILGGVMSALGIGGHVTGQQGDDLLKDQENLTKAVRKANGDYDAAVAATADPKQRQAALRTRNEEVKKAFKGQIDSLVRESARLKGIQDSVTLVATHNGVIRERGQDQTQGIANVEGRAQQLRDAMHNEMLDESITSGKTNLGTLKEGKDAAEEARKADAERLKQMEANLHVMQLNNSVSIKSQYDFWDRMRSAFKAGSDAYNDVVAKQATLAEEGAKAGHELIQKGMKAVQENAALSPAAANEGIAKFNELMREQAEDVFKSGERWKAYNAEVTRGAEIQAKAAEVMRALQIKHGVATGALGKGDAASLSTQSHIDAANAKIAALQTQLSQLRADDANLDKHGKDYERQHPALVAQQQGVQNQIDAAKYAADIQATEDKWSEFSETALGGAVTALQELIAAGRDSAAIVRQFVSSSLSSVNQGIVHDLTTGGGNRHKIGQEWTGIGHSIFTDATSSALKKGEGSLMSAFGIGGKTAPKGTASDPIHVIMAGLTGGSSGISSLASGASNSGALMGIIGSLIPHFADGGAYSAGTLAMVGERGPEPILFGSDARIIPNHEIGTLGGASGGDTHIHIDARGATDPAQTMMLVQQGIKAAAPHIMAATIKAGRDQSSRMAPAGRR
jgi:hypothetical protein